MRKVIEMSRQHASRNEKKIETLGKISRDVYALRWRKLRPKLCAVTSSSLSSSTTEGGFQDAAAALAGATALLVAISDISFMPASWPLAVARPSISVLRASWRGLKLSFIQSQFGLISAT